MLIEQKTTYAYKLKYLDNPTFDKVRYFAKKFIDELPKELVDELYSQLERGVVQIDSEPQMLVYLYSFGKMHQAKLNKAFENIPEVFYEQPEINIIDYGCGQAIGTMCYADFLKGHNYAQKIKSVTLIEPSEICIKRAALHVSKFLPDAEIITVNKEFDQLLGKDIVCKTKIPTIHILSNVLDITAFNIDRFSKIIKKYIQGYNQFICVEPYFNIPKIDGRIDIFSEIFNGKDSLNKTFAKYEINPSMSWTAHIRCFSVNEPEDEVSTEVTKDDIWNGVRDRSWVTYSKDGKRLLRGNIELEAYMVKNGTKAICDDAFNGNLALCGCTKLQQISIPNSVSIIGRAAFCRCTSLQQITIPDTITNISDSTFEDCDSLQQITIPNTVTSIGKWAFEECSSLQHITIPNVVTSIGESAFAGCSSLKTITIPNSVTSINESTFEECSSLQQITIPNTITYIGSRAFEKCSSLQKITIPACMTSIEESTFYGCLSLLQITIPNMVTNIGERAFCFCKSLRQITIPNSVITIGNDAFAHCKSLQQIIIPENSVEKFKQILPKELWDKLYCLQKTEKKQVDEYSPF